MIHRNENEKFNPNNESNFEIPKKLSTRCVCFFFLQMFNIQRDLFSECINDADVSNVEYLIRSIMSYTIFPIIFYSNGMNVSVL